MTLKFEDGLFCSKSYLTELRKKAAFWDVFSLLNSKDEFQWLLPFFWNEDANGVTEFAEAVAMTHVYFGQAAVANALSSPTWFSIAEVLREFEKSGGHPIGERTLFVLFRLLNGRSYEDVMAEEKNLEVELLYERKRDLLNGESRRAIERVKCRMKRAKNLLKRKGINVKRLSPKDKVFRELVRQAELSLNRDKHIDS